MKLNKLTILMGVGALTYASANFALLNTNAALTAPTNYDFAYRPISTGGTYYYLLEQKNGLYDYDPGYTRTTDGAYYNYTTTLTRDDYGYLPQGLEITQTFNRSNTSWASTGTGLYRTTDTKIGSDGTVGSINKKWYVKIDNQTNKDYKLYLDFSSTNNINRIYHYYVNGEVFVANLTNDRLYYVDSGIFFDIWISAYSYVEFYTENGASNLNYLDAWYLQDLGVSTSYEEGQYDGYGQGYDDGFDVGYDDGFGDGTSGVGMTAIFSLAFGVIESIFNIQVLGDITLGTIIIAPIAIALLWFILGIVSGVGGKKQ